MNVKAALFPTIFAMLMAIASIGIPLPGTMGGTPWLNAAHSQFINATSESRNVDNIAFFLWGLQYTVTGQTIQSKFVAYDPLRDFPMFSLYAIIMAIIISILAVIYNRVPSIMIKGREIKLKIPSEPITLLIVAMMFMIVGVVYLDFSSKATIIPALGNNNYNVETGIGFRFMEISIVGFLMSIFMTYNNAKSAEKTSEEEGEYERTGIDKEDISAN